MSARHEQQASRSGDRAGRSRRYWIGMARGAAGALLFSLPILMTMEMWWLGFDAQRARLALMLALTIPLLIGLSHYSGVRETSGWLGDAADALCAYGIGILTSAASLYVFGVVQAPQTMRDLVGKIGVEAIPAAIGAVLARSQLTGESSNGGEKERRKRNVGYWGELFLMASGSVYLAFSVAPTQEIVLIAVKMNAWRAIALALLSIMLLHAFVYALEFRGQERARRRATWWGVFLRFSIVGYALSLSMSAYILWTFGRFDAANPAWMVMECIVLAFPASVGAAAARLIL